MRVDPSLVRSGQWWNHKIPPLIAVAALTVASGNEVGGLHLVITLCLFLVATIGIAAFGHVVNDLADIRTDALAGKANQMASLGTRERASVVVATLVAGLVPWIWLPVSPLIWALIATEVVLLVIYSVPPLRLKDRSSLGVVADALYAYVIPVLLTFAVFAKVAGVSRPSPWVIGLVGLWGLLMGLRGILWHQIGDIAHDRRSGVHTLATRLGALRGRRILGVMVVVEFIVAITTIVVVAIASTETWLAIFAAAYLAYRAFQMSTLWSEPVRLGALRHSGGRVRFLGFVLLNEFVEKWLPLAAMVSLAIARPVMWPAVLVYVIVFENAAVEFLRRDLTSLPDAANRLAHERKSRRHIKAVAARRKSELAGGPALVDTETRDRCRWVFVVCGPEMHLDTLRTAVANLRPLTMLEIWVLTDSSRNVHPIDVDGVDRVVDVLTPPELDDHQASIWLKTSANRHLPPGEWCYLDSDIIAVRPGMEEVFQHRNGPVAFASDLTIAANQVDRFSPWAMNCECSGHGDNHSCSHLRDQIKSRLGVDVPGDWVHWNGGVFLFGDDSTDFLALWHRTSIDSFGWPEWRTRDQGALIATAWLLGQQDCPRLPAEFNFIADLGNGDLCLDPDNGWALHPAGPWHKARFLHLYTSRLEDPAWDFGRDVEAPVIRQTLVRVQRWRSFEVRNRAKTKLGEVGESVHEARQTTLQKLRDAYWASKNRLELYVNRARHTVTRMKPTRVTASVRRRLNGTQDIAGDDAVSNDQVSLESSSLSEATESDLSRRG